ncbi:hypothetical protein GCM10022419_105420 [Nonomuraea rosea]|uniref:Uncharacterized protein n=1 Tax=Nonomuraea rosea TaxID=638574 RepID=A0ABP6ZBC2_9ACTN
MDLSASRWSRPCSVTTPRPAGGASLAPVRYVPYLPQQSGYKQAVARSVATDQASDPELAIGSDFCFDKPLDHRLHADTLRMSPPTVQRSNLVG